MRLVPRPYRVYEVTREILEPWLTQENVSYILADGGFYVFLFLQWLQSCKVNFVIRGNMGDAIKELVQMLSHHLLQPRTGVIVPYFMAKPGTTQLMPLKLLIWRNKKSVHVFVLPADATLTPKEAFSLYRRRFTIETYYRMIHHFQPFTCSLHPVVRYCLVSLAIWLCNFWCYFRAPLERLQPQSRKQLADHVYSANAFCESMAES
ncbi:MAG: transposase [Candidatus Hermodarchaeota archaeon]